MKKYLALLAATAALVLMSACAPEPSGSGADASRPGQGGAPVSSDDTPQASSTPACTPVAGGIPATAKDFTCLNLVSTGGSDSTGELAWLGTDPFTVVTLPQDGALRFSSKTPCNTLMGSAEVSDTQLIVAPNLAMTMMMCQSPQNDYQDWVVKFFSAPLDFTLNEGSMVLKNAHGTVTFKPASA